MRSRSHLPTDPHPTFCLVSSSPLLSSPLLMAPRRAAAAARSKSNPPAPAPAPAARRQDAADTRWLQTLSEPELDLLMGLKEVAMRRASNAGHPALADKVFHLRALRALATLFLFVTAFSLSSGCTASIHSRVLLLLDFAAFVLLQEFKERLRQAPSSSFNNESSILFLERLALLNDPEEEVVRPSQDDAIPMPNGIRKKRKKIA